MTTFAVTAGQTTSLSANKLSAESIALASGSLARVEGVRTRRLGSVPASQAYYWHHRWQAAERETMASLTAGNGRRFTSSQDAIAWLLSDDEPAVAGEQA
jgi:hypothetical protein